VWFSHCTNKSNHQAIFFMVFIRCRLLLLFLYYTFGRDIHIFINATGKKINQRKEGENQIERMREGKGGGIRVV